MSFNVGTATDYIDLLNQLVQNLTRRHLEAIAINAGGTGHAVGDVITIDPTGSTSTLVAKIEVVTVAAGVITAARIYRAGCYTVDPTTTTGNAQSATTGAGIGATFNLTFASTGWTQLARSSVAASATVGAAGNGYNVGNVLTLIGGVLSVGGSAATFTVATLTGGAGSGVATVTLTSAGSYEVHPTNAVLTSNSGTGDNLATLNVTWSDLAGDTIVILQGDAGSSIDPLVGIHTWSSQLDESGANTVHNWSLHGMTTWSAALPLHQQANILEAGMSNAHNGAITTLTTSGDGAWVPLKAADAFNMTWWLSVTGRRVVMIVRVQGASTTYYAHLSFGLLNPFGTATEIPYPLYVAGASDRPKAWYRDTASLWGGLSEPISRNNGPAFVWEITGNWIQCRVATIGSNVSLTPTYSTIGPPRAVAIPLGVQNQQSVNDDKTWDQPAAGGFWPEQITLAASATRIYRTPDTGGDLFPLFPVGYSRSDDVSILFYLYGEVEGVFWLDQGGSGITSEDRVLQGSSAYTIFQNGTRVQPYSFLALRED